VISIYSNAFGIPAKRKGAIPLSRSKYKAMNKQNVTLKKAMIEALEKSLGIVTTACKIVKIERNTHYRWMREDEEYKEAVNGIEDIAIDFAESKLHSQIDKGDTTATIFYLKTKGKKRGYIERTEYQIDVEKPIFKLIDLDVNTNDSPD
jgi:hypothetical protein